MKRKKGHGRPMNSNKVRVKAVPRNEIDTKKMALALVSIANDIAKNKAALSWPEDEQRAGLPAVLELSYDQV